MSVADDLTLLTNLRTKGDLTETEYLAAVKFVMENGGLEHRRGTSTPGAQPTTGLEKPNPPMPAWRARLNVFSAPILAIWFAFLGYALFTDAIETEPSPTTAAFSITKTASPNLSSVQPLTWGEADHAGEMELCKQQIAGQVIAIYEWNWDRAWAVGQRRIRKATIAFLDRAGRIRRDTATCTFDEPPAGNDYFIGK